LQAAFLIETAPAHKFQMKKQLEEAEAELTGIQDKIDDLYQQAEQLAANPTN
jgi:septation ring formation regulator EzrA